MLRLFSAITLLAVLAVGCGFSSSEATPYSVSEVTKTFAAHGERLTDRLYPGASDPAEIDLTDRLSPGPSKTAENDQPHELKGFTPFSDQDQTLVAVKVWNRTSGPPVTRCIARASGSSRCNEQLVVVGNVLVEFDPGGACANRVRAAIRDLQT